MKPIIHHQEAREYIAPFFFAHDAPQPPKKLRLPSYQQGVHSC